MTNRTVEQKLLDLGCKVWEASNHKRIYINGDALLETVFGLKIERYKSGGLKSVELNGEKISNNKAFKLLNEKFYFDCVNQKWCAPINPII